MIHRAQVPREFIWKTVTLKKTLKRGFSFRHPEFWFRRSLWMSVSTTTMENQSTKVRAKVYNHGV